jgi:integrase
MLTETAIKNAKPKEKKQKLSDAGGLYLEVTPTGSKIWRMKYRYDGKEKLLTIGSYPAVTLKQARDIRDKAKAQLSVNIDPSTAKQQAKAQRIEQATHQQHEALKEVLTFEKLFYQWYDTRTHEWSDAHSTKVMQRVKNHLLPYIGITPIAEITPLIMIETLKRLDDAGKTHMRMKLKGIASMVFKYGVGYGLTNNDPTASLPDNIFKAHIVEHYATVTDPKDIANIMQMLNGCDDNSAVCWALKLAPLVFLRPSELCGLRWDEIDLDAKLIRISKERMKMKQAHVIPLSRQALAIIENRAAYRACDYVFTNYSTYQPIKSESLRQRIRRLGIDKETLTPHGFRHMASTRLNEMGFDADVIERQLAHQESNSVRRAYNHADYLPKRFEMMQQWADWLDDLKG